VYLDHHVRALNLLSVGRRVQKHVGRIKLSLSTADGSSAT
jgi:hypothetical protein